MIHNKKRKSSNHFLYEILKKNFLKKILKKCSVIRNTLKDFNDFNKIKITLNGRKFFRRCSEETESISP